MARQVTRYQYDSHREIFNALVLNAIDFANSTIDNLELNPKYSIVEFYTAIELFLKAKLMEEHWALVLSKPESADFDKFQKGDFVSVNLIQCEKRLRLISRSPISTEAMKNFEALREHRNRIVHFAHGDFADKEKRKAAVVVELYKSWHHLHILLTETWGKSFAPYVAKLDELHSRILRNRDFLETRYKELEAAINEMKSAGIIFVTCSHCECEGGRVLDHKKWGAEYDCLVCGCKGTKLAESNAKIPCPYCETDFEFFNGAIDECPNCKHPITVDDRINQCAKVFVEGDDWCEGGVYTPASCWMCNHMPGSVFYFEGLWNCVACFERGWQAMECPHCGEFVTGDLNTLKYCWCHKCEPDYRSILRSGMI